MKKIALSQGLFATVDDADYDWLSQWGWSASRQGRKGCIAPKYRAVRVEKREGKQRAILMHRQIMAPNVGEVIDHINGDPLDNRRENMRVTDQRANSINRVGWHKKPGHKGVHWHKGGQKWMTMFRGKYLGLFASDIEAAKAYNQAAISHGGEIPLNAVGG